jgi:hypothetical protein
MDKLPFDDVENAGRHQCFVVFEPASIRINDADVLLIGDQVREMYDNFMMNLVSREQTMTERILHNRLAKIGSMLDLLQSYDNVIVTRFFDRIWRRYSYVSHLGELFVDLETYVDYFPEHKSDCSQLVATRFDESADFDDDDDNDDSDDDSDESDDKAEESDDKKEK